MTRYQDREGRAPSSERAIPALVAATADRYRSAGKFARWFAFGKLRGDPLYLTLLRRGLIPDRARVVDLGCGQGIPFALFVAARAQYLAGEWPAGWPAPPAGLDMLGIERHPLDVRRARLALGELARVEQQDLNDARLTVSDAIVLLDVLHYLGPRAQERLLEQAVGKLAPGGLLIARVCDGAATFGALAVRAGDGIVAALRHGRVAMLHLRSAAEWIRLLEKLGMSVEADPMGQGTPFANVLLVARHRQGVYSSALAR
jgi:SAM-dependent methyltransferase